MCRFDHRIYWQTSEKASAIHGGNTGTSALLFPPSLSHDVVNLDPGFPPCISSRRIPTYSWTQPRDISIPGCPGVFSQNTPEVDLLSWFLSVCSSTLSPNLISERTTKTSPDERDQQGFPLFSSKYFPTLIHLNWNVLTVGRIKADLPRMLSFPRSLI